jgi:hypothetical protein
MKNQVAIEQALKTFVEALLEKPMWVIAISYKGRFIGRYGEYEDETRRIAREMMLNTFGHFNDAELLLTPLNDEKVTQITFEYALATQKFNEQLKAERDTFAIALDGNYIIWFTFKYIIGINFSNVSIASFNQTLDTIYHKVAVLHDEIWKIDGYHQGE